MLVSFSVSNFRSFGDEVTLNMVASNKLEDHPGHCVPIPHTTKSVLRTAVLYGANAAGKSNLVKAIDVAQKLVCGRGSGGAILPFRFREPSNARIPTSFEFRFLVNETIFIYGFDIGAKNIFSEWLAFLKGKDEIELFERNEAGNTTVNDDAQRYIKDEIAFKTLNALKALQVRKDQLFLNRALELPVEAQGHTLSAIIKWFTEDLVVLLVDSLRGNLLDRLEKDARFRQFSSRFLNSVGTGIGDLLVHESEREGDDFERQVLLQMKGPLHPMFAYPSADTEIRVNPDKPDKIVERKLYAFHNQRFPLPFSEESDGTKVLLQLMPFLWSHEDENKVVVIDELDRSLHPLLCWEFIRFYSESCLGARRQLIVTTHEAHLLDQNLLRRDEYWFVEKDKDQQSRLVSLLDFNIRNDLQIQKGYLHGRFGAVPMIGGMQQLEELLNCSGEETSDNAEKASPIGQG